MACVSGVSIWKSVLVDSRVLGQLWIAVSTSMASSLPVFGGLALRFGCSLPCLVSYGVLTMYPRDVTYHDGVLVVLRCVRSLCGRLTMSRRVPNRQLSLWT